MEMLKYLGFALFVCGSMSSFLVFSPLLPPERGQTDFQPLVIRHHILLQHLQIIQIKKPWKSFLDVLTLSFFSYMMSLVLCLFFLVFSSVVCTQSCFYYRTERSLSVDPLGKPSGA